MEEYDEPELPVAPDDLERDALPSDDESGPENPDPESFAGDDAGADDTEEEEPQIDAVAVAAVAVTGGSVAAMPALPTAAAGAAAPGVPRPPGLHALTEADASKLKVPELKMHLVWRGLSDAGLKPLLQERLCDALRRGVPLLDVLVGGRQPPPVPVPEPKWGAWIGLDETAAIPRPQFAGDEDWKPSASVGLRANDHPFMWFNKYMTTAMREELVSNSNKYHGYLRALGKEVYPHAQKIKLADIDLYLAMLILNGLSPVHSIKAMHMARWAIKGTRAADLLTRDRFREISSLLHITAPIGEPKRGSREWDTLYKVRPLLDHFLQNSVDNVQPGLNSSIDEITWGFQGRQADLKQRCGKFKRAGDGFQADALVLDGGYLLYCVFRGDNTAPVFEKSFSPLHNRCLLLLSKLTKDASRVFWDNLYPSVDVSATFAMGGSYTTSVPAGAKHGAEISITVPKVLTAGTARTNRGVPAACRQPDKAKLTPKQVEALKAKEPEERVKAQVTDKEPHVLCVSYFDNGPVHMLSTIHSDAEFVIVKKRVWSATEKKKIDLDIPRLRIIDDYNRNMNNVDRFDQLSNYYSLDGMGWRDRKWWHPIFKGIVKGSCDNAYTLYKKQFEIEKKANLAAVQALADLARASRAVADSPAGNTRRYALGLHLTQAPEL